MSSPDYRRFWQWFVDEMLPTLARREVPDEATIHELDRRVDGLGLSWELGPSTDGGGWAFAVSFGADRDLLPSAASLVDVAPRMDGCQIVLGKPPKQWDGVLDLHTHLGKQRFFTADWMCHLLPMNDGFAVLVVPTDVDEHVDDETLAEAVAIAVESELGEVRFARQVRDVSVVHSEHAAGLRGVRCRMRDLRTAAAPA